MDALLRRLVTIPGLLVVLVLVTVTAPLWIPLTWLIGRLTPWHGLSRLSLFLLAYLWCQAIGIAACFGIWCRWGFCRRGSPRYPAFLASNFRLQCWWANALKRSGEWLYRLRFQVSGQDALPGPPVILLPRHASSGDTVIPIVFYARPCQRPVRYVMKRELLIDPCLDVVGHRLPNYFVDRRSRDSDTEIQGVVGLLDDLGGDSIVIFPEGTRFTPEKRARILPRLEGEVAARARGWERVLPPRPGGPLALLAQNPGLDLLLCAHSGLEEAASVRALLTGSAVGASIRIHFWRIPFADIPAGSDRHWSFLLDCWARMNDEVARLSDTPA